MLLWPFCHLHVQKSTDAIIAVALMTVAAAVTAALLVRRFIARRAPNRKPCPGCGFFLEPGVEACPECGRKQANETRGRD